MESVVHRQQAEINMPYVNIHDESTRSLSVKDSEVHPGQRLMRVVAVSFGLLCFLQVALNVSLRLVLYTPDKQTLDPDTFCKNVTAVEDEWCRLAATDQYFKQGWVYFHPSFYYISSNTTTWQESREDCLQRDADLVIINTKEEQDFTRKFDKSTWIGLSKNPKTGEWIWVDGTELTISYWGKGEPNNLGGRNEDCVDIRFRNENSWNDAPCQKRDFWICEKNLSL